MSPTVVVNVPVADRATNRDLAGDFAAEAQTAAPRQSVVLRDNQGGVGTHPPTRISETQLANRRGRNVLAGRPMNLLRTHHSQV